MNPCRSYILIIELFIISHFINISPYQKFNDQVKQKTPADKTFSTGSRIIKQKEVGNI